MNEPIYAVYATDVDRDHLIAYATGNPKDIEEVYKDRGGYGLLLKPIKIVHITGETGQRIKKLREEKLTAEHNLKIIQAELSKLGIKS